MDNIPCERRVSHLYKNDGVFANMRTGEEGESMSMAMGRSKVGGRWSVRFWPGLKR